MYGWRKSRSLSPELYFTVTLIVRMAVTADDQRMSAAPKPNHKSAYDDSMFTKRGGNHGH